MPAAVMVIIMNWPPLNDESEATWFYNSPVGPIQLLSGHPHWRLLVRVDLAGHHFPETLWLNQICLATPSHVRSLFLPGNEEQKGLT